MLNTKRIRFFQQMLGTLPAFFFVMASFTMVILFCHLVLCFCLFYYWQVVWRWKNILVWCVIYDVTYLHKGGLTIILLFLLLLFLSKFCLSVTKAMLKNDGQILMKWTILKIRTIHQCAQQKFGQYTNVLSNWKDMFADLWLSIYTCPITF